VSSGQSLLPGRQAWELELSSLFFGVFVCLFVFRVKLFGQKLMSGEAVSFSSLLVSPK
jgi:hypothetical protein